MGGETNLSPQEDSSLDHDFPQLSSPILRDDGLSTKVESFGVDEGGELTLQHLGQRNSLSSSDLEADQRRRDKVYNEILQSYDELRICSQGLEEAKSKILSYKPGTWVENAGSMRLSDYDVPTTTTLILIGPKGSGKSSLVNRISKVFEHDKFASERAQVTYNLSAGDGTLFLQEYMIPRGSSSFCLYDTRSLSDDSSENIEMLKHWMTRGVCNGKLVVRESDSPSLKNRMKCKARRTGYASGEITKVNFVIFVVDGLSVLKAMENDEEPNRLYKELIASAFNCPYVSFQDDKPLVVVTHGDLLSRIDRARIRVHLGELLGIPPTKQIFDIPDNFDPETELTVVNMLRYSLEHADKNLPRKRLFMNRTNRVGSLSKITLPKLVVSPFSSSSLLLFLVLGISIISALVLRGHSHHGPWPRVKLHKFQAKDDIQWHKIRHLWLG